MEHIVGWSMSFWFVSTGISALILMWEMRRQARNEEARAQSEDAQIEEAIDDWDN